VEEKEKVFHLCHHSEKLAIALWHINKAPGTPLQIRKSAGMRRLPLLPQISFQK